MEPAQGEEQPSVGAPVVSRSVEIPEVSFRSFLAASDPPRLHWADRDGIEVVGSGAAVRLGTESTARFEAIRDAATELFERIDHDGPPQAVPRLFGGFSFRADYAPTPPWSDFESAAFVLPRQYLLRRDDETWLTVSGRVDRHSTAEIEADLEATAAAIGDLPDATGGEPPGVEDTRITTTRSEWIDGVERALERIEAGTIEKVVLATAMEVDLQSPVNVPWILGRLRRTYPDCYRFLFEPTEGTSFFGPPPEQLVALSDGHVETEALAGSVPRGETPETDEEYAASLREDPKIQHEQGLVVDAITDDLSAFGPVTEGDRRVHKLTNIQHLRTPIEATVDEDVHVLDLAAALHPTPAVGGTPKESAMETIREIEPFDRGWYAAPIGWFDGTGDGEFSVGIRSGVVSGRSATLFAGNGIVADSDPADEWEELQPKYRPLLDEFERR